MKIRNTSAIPLRAAYLHGPYALYAACYPSAFDPNSRQESYGQDGVPQFEPNLKAGGSFLAKLVVPENIRETAGKANVKRTTEGRIPNLTWILEVSSQVIFSTTAAVHYELLVGRDEKSVELGLSALTGSTVATPGQLQDHQQGKRKKENRNTAQPRGLYSKAVDLVVDDTASLWSKPALPGWSNDGRNRGDKSSHTGEIGVADQVGDGLSKGQGSPNGKSKFKKKRKVHLVILTHGLHSNLGADMLYLKESIDAAAKQTRADARDRRANAKTQRPVSKRGREAFDTTKPELSNDDLDTSAAQLSSGQGNLDESSDDENEGEDVVVRGYFGNAVRTERGIQYLGKRLAKFVLSMTYPDQPYLPVKKSVKRKLSRAFTGQEPANAPPAHHNSSIHKESKTPENLAYQITSISFIGHSLGGLTQTYAIAYIHKHSPQFFEKIKPVNFIAMASPLLGLSNENPIYVKFALDFGLVGRTGQDLGLTWRAPTVVRSGWGAMIGGIGSEGQRAHRQSDPGSKPLLRVLPTGPAHPVLKMFRNRTVYSNVVNDGIVPLRTSCLLFLDWRGLGRVEKARRENGLVGTMAGWGWAELTGANSFSHRPSRGWLETATSSQGETSGEEEDGSPSRVIGAKVPLPAANAVQDDNTVDEMDQSEAHQVTGGSAPRFQDEDYDADAARETAAAQPSHPFGGFLSFLHPGSAKQSRHHHSPKHTKIYKRSQTLKGDEPTGESSESTNVSATAERPKATRGDSILGDPENVFAPPKTTVFEAAGDLLNPPLPSENFLIDPTSRPRTIFHDRVYHPEDIPSPPPKPRSSLRRSVSSDSKGNSAGVDSNHEHSINENPDSDGMKVEEKIARAYHRDLSWRKVLVRLEPDAHNNMVVRRMFANAYGWPVVKHLIDTHFADTYSAVTDDRLEPAMERARSVDEAVGKKGDEVKGQLQKPLPRTDSESREATDDLHDLDSTAGSSLNSKLGRPRIAREDSAQWDDRMFDVTDDDDDDDYDGPSLGTSHISASTQHTSSEDAGSRKGTSDAEISDFLNASPPRDGKNSNAQPRKLEIPDPSIATHLSASPVATDAGSLGLRKPVTEQLNSTDRRRSGDVTDSGHGVSKRVARMSIG